ncbi:MAG TPA: hypothetical protein VK633_09535 [Verrucomicrobiae bacterium]|nr:hypothetical protein [Verrucomicrobiae bacterium]
MTKNPNFFYYPDRFQKPNPFQPDVVIEIDSVLEKKLDALAVMESQFYEGGANGSTDLLPAEPAQQKARHQKVREGFARRNQSIAERYPAKLGEWYPAGRASEIKHAEAFEICEYGSQPDKAELKRLFPFFE